MPPTVLVGDHDPAHARYSFAVAFQSPESGIFVLDYTIWNRSRELRRRHRHRSCECSHAGHILFLLSVDFSTVRNFGRGATRSP
jgi:hypothetical protein